jgi:cytochrome c-type biogenesis protein CcmH/NrfG
MSGVPARGPALLHHLLGVALEWCGLDAGASQAFRDAVREAPTHAETWFRLGEALARRGLWHEASDAFREAARLGPESPEHHGNLVLALARARLWDEVVGALARMACLRPRDGEVHVLLAGVLRKMKRNHEAIRVLRLAVRLGPAPATKRFFLGEALLGPAGWSEARAAWLEARRVPAATPSRSDHAPGRSPLHRHPGPTLGPAAPPAAKKRSPIHTDESFSAVLARERRAREILHVYRETVAFPIRHGDRPAVVHVAPIAVNEARRRRSTGSKRP